MAEGRSPVDALIVRPAAARVSSDVLVAPHPGSHVFQ
jgi:hypothetical protein